MTNFVAMTSVVVRCKKISPFFYADPQHKQFIYVLHIMHHGMTKSITIHTQTIDRFTYAKWKYLKIDVIEYLVNILAKHEIDMEGFRYCRVSKWHGFCHNGKQLSLKSKSQFV